MVAVSREMLECLRVGDELEAFPIDRRGDSPQNAVTFVVAGEVRGQSIVLRRVNSKGEVGESKCYRLADLKTWA